MALTVNTNTYVNLSEANSYFAARLFSDEWTTKNDPTKEGALLMATRHLDRLYDWLGAAASVDQMLVWPRSGLYTPNGAVLDASVVPQDIKDAQCELAYQWCQADQLTPSAVSFTASDENAAAGGVKKEQLGDMVIEYQSASGNPLSSAMTGGFKKVYPLVDMLVGPYIAGRSGSFSLRIAI